MLAATGISIGVFVWAVLFSFGVGAFLKAYPEALVSLKLLGGGYVFYLGSKALNLSFHNHKDYHCRRLAPTGWPALKCGLVVVLTNPNTAMLWVVVSMFIASASDSRSLFLVVGVCLSVSAICIYGIYAALFSTDVTTRIYHKFFRYIEAVIGMVLVGVGWVLIMDVLRELQG